MSVIGMLRHPFGACSMLNIAPVRKQPYNARLLKVLMMLRLS